MLFDSEALLSSPHPFWFASTDLLTSVLAAEVNAVSQLLANHPDIRNLFDAPEATVAERRACFKVLAHRTIMDIIYEMFAARYEQSPFLGDTETRVLNCTQNLDARDAPAWVLEMSEVVKLLAFHINDALPEPLRTAGFGADNSARAEAIKTAAKMLNSAEKIQVLTGRVLDQQLRRLERRWSAANAQRRRPNKRKGWEKREKLYRAIREALTSNPSLQGMDLCSELDKRHAPPLLDWQGNEEWREWYTFKQAWLQPGLRRKIRRVRQEAMKRR